LAHELTHVIQQGSAGSSALRTPASSRTRHNGAHTRPVAGPARNAVPTIQRQASGHPGPAPEAEAAVRHAKAIQSAGNILFDSWYNDVRDNDNDGIVDGPSERQPDGSHYHQTHHHEFGVVAGNYLRGWPDQHNVSHSHVIVPATRTIHATHGAFKYRVCADVVSQAYADAGLMNHMRSTAEIIDRFRRIGTVWHGRSTFPPEYLPGDFVGTYRPREGGHSGIVTKRSPTSSAPTVIELPGPSTQADAGTYDPVSTNDVREEPWSKQGVAGQDQYLGRYTGRHHHGHHHGHHHRQDHRHH